MRDPRDVFVIDYGGIYGLYVQANTIEMFGLCNEDIALKGNTHGINPVFRKTGLDCYLAFNPDDFHANRPFLRPLDAFKNQAQMIKAVFQGKALDRVLDLKKRYATGRVNCNVLISATVTATTTARATAKATSAATETATSTTGMDREQALLTLPSAESQPSFHGVILTSMDTMRTSSALPWISDGSSMAPRTRNAS